MPGLEWVVSSVVRFTGNGPVFMTRLASATQSANAQFARQQGLITKADAALLSYQRRMEAIRMQQLKMAQGFGGAAFLVGAVGIGAAVSQAAKLQQILLSIKNETGASNAQLGAFYNTAFKIANANGMSVEAGGEILRTISRLSAGQFDIAKMIKVAPTVAGYASSVHFNRPDISVEEAAKTGIQTAHLFRAYQPEQLSKLLDSVYRLSGMMSEKPDAALRQMSYYVPMFKAMHVDDESSIATMALLDRGGFRNKVGTNVRAMVLQALGPLQLTQSAQAGKGAILEQMGLLKGGKFAWNTKSGGLDFFGELGAIGNWAQTQQKKGIPSSTIAKMMYSALGAQGGTVGSLFLDPQMAPILAGLRAYLKDKNVGLGAATKNRDQGLGYQFDRAVHNFSAVMTELGYPWLKDLTDFFQGLGDNLHNFQAWLHGHRDAEKTIGSMVAGLTAIAGITFTAASVTMFLNAAKALKLLAAAGAVGGGTAAAAGSTAAIVAGMRASAAAGAAIPLAARFATLGTKIIPIVGQLGLLYTALEVLVTGANWLAYDVLHLKKSERYTHKATLNHPLVPDRPAFTTGAGRYNHNPALNGPPIHVEHLSVSLPGVKTWQEVEAFMHSLKDPRSPQASNPSKGATTSFGAPVLQLGLAR